MTKDELLVILRAKLAKYHSVPYSELSKRVGNRQPETDSHGEPSDQNFYQTEVEIVRDDAQSGNLRVIGMIDNGRGLSGTYDLIISPDGTLLSEGGSVRGCRAGVFKTALSLFLLRELPFSRFNFPRWQSVLIISLIGVLIGLDPSFRAAPPDMPVLPLWLAASMGLATTWVAFLIIVGVLRWWMKRGGRWDGQGDLFNLVAASWLVADTLGAGLTALGIPSLFTLPLWLYSVWVGANALSGAIPKASLSYSIGGIVVGFIPAMLAAMVVFVMLSIELGPAPLTAGGSTLALTWCDRVQVQVDYD